MAQQTTPLGRAAAPPPIPIQEPRPFWASWRFVALAVLGLTAYVIGWRMTDISIVDLVTNLPKARHIVVQLLTPNFLNPEMTVQEDAISIVMASRDFTPPVPERQPKPGPQVQLSSRVVTSGETIQVSGTGWPTNADGVISYNDNPIATATTNAEGAFSESVTMPTTDARGVQFINVKFAAPVVGPLGFQKYTWSEAARISFVAIIETIFLALMGTTFSVIVAAPLSFLGARNIMSGSKSTETVYYATRSFFNILRSIETLIVVVIMAVIVGIGSFAGVLAIAIHGIGALGKLYSEAIEGIDNGPIEAVRATGANNLQMVMYAVLPQVVPAFVSFTFYRWDINVRMATVIGLVGGGGIGFILIQFMNLLLWRQAAVALWMIVAVVMAMDYASSYVRHKLV
ncbi:MAG: phosphonate ABC transporter, permease protein PhnE [Anaerolineae bacterium]|nr:phosphonate ABC transporter, permease protein PhnE [Anaerolineae bacterium]